jgi:hypothetical protein
VFTNPSDWTPLYEPYGNNGSKKTPKVRMVWVANRDLLSLIATLDEVSSPLHTA